MQNKTNYRFVQLIAKVTKFNEVIKADSVYQFVCGVKF